MISTWASPPEHVQTDSLSPDAVVSNGGTADPFTVTAQFETRWVSKLGG
jgi:hypothetical protein